MSTVVLSLLIEQCQLFVLSHLIEQCTIISTPMPELVSEHKKRRDRKKNENRPCMFYKDKDKVHNFGVIR